MLSSTIIQPPAGQSQIEHTRGGAGVVPARDLQMA
jgi:hypothetical protein